jgi:ribosomal protein S1
LLWSSFLLEEYRHMLRATVESVSNDQAIVRFEDGQMLRIPVSAIEGDSVSGQDVRVIVVRPTAEDAGRQLLARDLLNEILGT